MDAISLPTLMLHLDLVDLIDLDVRGGEFHMLTAATVPLAQKVKRVHVETHSEQLQREHPQIVSRTWLETSLLVHVQHGRQDSMGANKFQIEESKVGLILGSVAKTTCAIPGPFKTRWCGAL